MALVIDSLKGMFQRRLQTHINQEFGEGFPALAKANAASAIVLVPSIVWVPASLLHIVPAPIFRSSGPAKSMSVNWFVPHD